MNRSWPALLVAPSTALGLQSVMYAMVTPLCASQMRAWMHLAAGLALAFTLVLTWRAYGEWATRTRAAPGNPDSDAADANSTRRFIAIVATAVGTLSSLVILSMWMAAWVLSPCALYTP